MSSERRRNTLTLVAVAGTLLAGWRLGQRKAVDIHGHIVIITGGFRGLGLALAEEFALQGARLVLSTRDEQELEQARQHLAHQGAEVLAFPGDMTQREQVQHEA